MFALCAFVAARSQAFAETFFMAVFADFLTRVEDSACGACNGWWHEKRERERETLVPRVNKQLLGSGVQVFAVSVGLNQSALG